MSPFLLPHNRSYDGIPEPRGHQSQGEQTRDLTAQPHCFLCHWKKNQLGTGEGGKEGATRLNGKGLIRWSWVLPGQSNSYVKFTWHSRVMRNSRNYNLVTCTTSMQGWPMWHHLLRGNSVLCLAPPHHCISSVGIILIKKVLKEMKQAFIYYLCV